MPLDPTDLLAVTTSLAVRPFRSAQDAVEATLELAVHALGMRTAFLTRTDLDRGLLRVEAVRNSGAGFAVPQGLELPLVQTP